MKFMAWDYIRSLAEEGISGAASLRIWGFGTFGGEKSRMAAVPVRAGTGASREWELGLGAKARALLFKQALPAPPPTPDSQAFQGFCRCLAGYLPDSLLMALTLFSSDSRAPGFMLVRGLPQDGGSTFETDSLSVSDKRAVVSEAILGAMTSVLGAPLEWYGDEGEEMHAPGLRTGGRPPRSDEGRPIEDDLRTDGAHRDHPADYVLYLGTGREDRQAACSRVALVVEALAILPEESVRVLRLPLFRIAASSALHSGVQRRVWSHPMPLIFDAEACPATRLGGVSMMALSPEAEGALAAYRDALRAVSRDVLLRPGDALLIDNRKAVHSSLMPPIGGNRSSFCRVSVRAKGKAAGGQTSTSRAAS